MLHACSLDRTALNAFRSLCSVTKRDVDMFLCRAVRLHFIMPDGPYPDRTEIYIVSLDPSSLPEERPSAYHPMPLLALVPRAQNMLTEGIHPAMMFALWNAQCVSMYLTDLHHDHLWSMQALQNNTKYFSPVKLLRNVSSLVLYHCGSPDLSILGRTTINLPPRIKNLRLTLPGGICNSTVEYHHTAQVLTLSFPQHLVCVCGCATGLLNASVRRLRIEVCKAKYATAYLETLKGRTDLSRSFWVVVCAKQHLTALQAGSRFRSDVDGNDGRTCCRPQW